MKSYMTRGTVVISFEDLRVWIPDKKLDNDVDIENALRKAICDRFRLMPDYKKFTDMGMPRIEGNELTEDGYYVRLRK